MESTRTTHPILILAGISVILLSATGIGAIMGWIPTSTGGQADHQLVAAAAPAQPSEPVATPAQRTEEVSAPAPKVLAPRAPKPAAVKKQSTPVAAREEMKREPRVESPIEPRVDSQPPPPPPSPALLPPPPPPVYVAAAEQAKHLCNTCGVVESVREIQKPGDASGGGAVAGGVIGGVVGNQMGAGRGRDVMTVLGAIGGAFAGHQVEKSARKITSYEVLVRFEDGTRQTLTQSTAPTWRAGDRVRLLNGALAGNS